MNMYKIVGIFLATTCVLAPLRAQNQSYDQFAPKPVLPVAPQPINQPGAKTQVGGAAAEVLLPKLKGLVFVGRPGDVVTGKALVSHDVELKNVKIPDEEDFRTMISGYLGKKLTRGDLSGMITQIIVYYRKHDHPVTDVIVPQQEITGGVVQILILESQVGTVTVEGNIWFSSDEIRDSFRNKPGSAIIASDIQSDLSWANQNPFHTSDVVYQPGHGTGITDIVLQTHDRFPARFYTGYEDSGNSQTGFDRYIIGMNWGDAWDAGLGQQLNYQYTTSNNFHSLTAHSGSYVIPLPWHHTLTFFGNYVQTQSELPPFVTVNGLSYQASARYTIPLPNLGDYKSSFGVGFDYKYNLNALQFGTVPISNLPNEVAQFVMAYDSSMRDRLGLTSFDAQIYCSPGDLMSDNHDPNFNASHTGATANYAYATLALSRLTRLPADFSLFLRCVAQFSNSNLTASEQLGFGGDDTVRGYDEREFNSDEGYITNVELRTPSVSLGELLGWKDFNDQLQFLGFWDYGAGYNHQALPGENYETSLSSVGAGFRYSINTYLSVRADYGFQLLSTHLDNDHGGRGDIGVVLSY